MRPRSEGAQSDSRRKSGGHAQKQAATWLTSEQIERIRDARLTDTSPNYLQGRNETILKDAKKQAGKEVNGSERRYDDN